MPTGNCTGEGLRPYPCPTFPFKSWPYIFSPDTEVSFLARLLQVLSMHQTEGGSPAVASGRCCRAVRWEAVPTSPVLGTLQCGKVFPQICLQHTREIFSFILHVSFPLASRDTLDSVHSISVTAESNP